MVSQEQSEKKIQRICNGLSVETKGTLNCFTAAVPVSFQPLLIFLQLSKRFIAY